MGGMGCQGKYLLAFAFVLISLGQMIFHIQVHIDTSPRILLSPSLLPELIIVCNEKNLMVCNEPKINSQDV